MAAMKLWVRLLFVQCLYRVLGLTLMLLLLYMVVDLSIHGVRLFDLSAMCATAIYYLSLFALHVRLFVPLAFLLVLLKMLFDLMQHGEFIALQMAGLSKKKIVVPFFWNGLILMFALYANEEWAVPLAGAHVDTFYAAHSAHTKKRKMPHVQTLPLEDGTEILFQTLNREHTELFDLFWLRPHATFPAKGVEIWYAKYVRNREGRLWGEYVDHLVRGENGLMEIKASYETYPFDELKIDFSRIENSFIPISYRSLSTLFKQMYAARGEKAVILTQLSYKLATPLTLLLICFAVVPHALYFQRLRPTFAITALSLFAFVAWMTLLDGLLILGENQVFAAEYVIWGPLGILFGIAVKPFVRLH